MNVHSWNGKNNIQDKKKKKKKKRKKEVEKVWNQSQLETYAFCN